ncbi:MAG: glycosyltransferase family 4 protein [Vicinamibacteria bacterium]
MRIVLDCRSVFPGMGGIGRATACLARELPRALPEAELVCLLGARRPPEPLCTAPNALEVTADAAMIDPLFEQRRLPALLEDLGADLYHGTCFAIPLATSVRRVATVHDVVFRRRPDLVEPSLCAYLDTWTEASCRHADAVVTVSEFSRGELVALYPCPAERVHVVPNAVDERFHGVSRRAQRGRPYLLYVGALEEKKNVRQLLAGFAALLRREPRLAHDLVLVGGAGGAPFDVGRALLGEPSLRGRVHVLGHVPDAALLDLYARAELFCYLSEYEGYGLPPLEAMAAGVPCVVADRSSLPEVTAGAALLTDPHDPDAVSWAMTQALHDAGLRERLVARGRAVARRTSWAASASRLADVYRAVLGAQTPERPRAPLRAGGDR